jgi:hypothetical protein
MLRAKRTVESVIQELITGLESGDVILREEETASAPLASPATTSPPGREVPETQSQLRLGQRRDHDSRAER